MPVGTAGTVMAVSQDVLETLGAEITQANTCGPVTIPWMVSRGILRTRSLIRSSIISRIAALMLAAFFHFVALTMDGRRFRRPRHKPLAIPLNNCRQLIQPETSIRLTS